MSPAETLGTARHRGIVSDQRIELKPDTVGGWIRHRGWTMKVDSTARLTWPVYPFNPYANGPETSLNHAVAALSVPLEPRQAANGQPGLRAQRITFEIECAGTEMRANQSMHRHEHQLMNLEHR